MKVLITGADGQLGSSLLLTAPAHVQLVACSRAELDIADVAQVRRVVADHLPNAIINAAAYTAVDQAEIEADQAWRVNAAGPRYLAQVAAQFGVRLLHVSTDYVFAGDSARPYRPKDATVPQNNYGRSKLHGEGAVCSLLPNDSVVLRTAWVYGASGRNFLRTMLRLMREKGSVRVVADQVGSPTATHSISDVLWRFAAEPSHHGIFHFTDAGVASWYDFAVAIAEEACTQGLLNSDVQVLPITTEEYPTPARRPRYSVLDCTATDAALQLTRKHWRTQLRRVMKEMEVA
ncbi:MAG TPA: dTDP-4-dehydrorhamnose reductase [Steroidobacteraceae bacterium]|nr:dTDP-4-dehydrorhamnose reductase [Steroidobacteraceae bacterium]